MLERFIAQLRSRVEERLWYTLGRSVTEEQRQHLQDLLLVAEGNRSSRLDQLRSGPVMVAHVFLSGEHRPYFRGWVGDFAGRLVRQLKLAEDSR